MQHDGSSDQRAAAGNTQRDGTGSSGDDNVNSMSGQGSDADSSERYEGMPGQQAEMSETDRSAQRDAVSEQQALTVNVSEQHSSSDQLPNDIVVSEQPASAQQASTSVTYSVTSKPVTAPCQLSQQYELQFNTDMQQNITTEQQILTGQQIQTTGQVVSEPNIVISAQSALMPARQANASVQQFITIKSEQDLLSPSQYALAASAPQSSAGQLLFTPGLQIVKSEHHFAAPRQHVLSPRQQLVATAHGPQIVIHGQQIGTPGLTGLPFTSPANFSSGQHVIPYIQGQPAAGHVMLANHSPQFVAPGHNVVQNPSRGQSFSQQIGFPQQGAMSPSVGPQPGRPATPIQSLVHMNRTNPLNDVEYMYSQYLRMLNR